MVQISYTTPTHTKLPRRCSIKVGTAMFAQSASVLREGRHKVTFAVSVVPQVAQLGYSPPHPIALPQMWTAVMYLLRLAHKFHLVLLAFIPLIALMQIIVRKTLQKMGVQKIVTLGWGAYPTTDTVQTQTAMVSAKTRAMSAQSPPPLPYPSVQW